MTISLTRKEKQFVNQNFYIIQLLKSEFFPNQILKTDDKLLLDFYFIAYSILSSTDQKISTEKRDRCLELFEEILIKTDGKSYLHSKAAINLYAYYFNKNSKLDRKKAFSYLHHHIDKTLYTPMMYYHLGVDFEAGINVPKNSIEAYRCYYQAAIKNNYDAALNIALLIYANKNLQSYLITQNIDATILSNKCLLVAADPEHGNMPEAQYVLALNYLRRENLVAINELTFHESIRLGKDWLFLSYRQNYPLAKNYIHNILTNASAKKTHDLSDMPMPYILFLLGELNSILISENFYHYFLQTIKYYYLAIQYGMDTATSELEQRYQYLLIENIQRPNAEITYLLAQILLSDIYKFIPQINAISEQVALQLATLYLNRATALSQIEMQTLKHGRDEDLLPTYRSLLSKFTPDTNAKILTSTEKKTKDFIQRVNPHYQTNYFLFKRHYNQFSKQFYQVHSTINNAEKDPTLPKPGC